MNGLTRKTIPLRIAWLTPFSRHSAIGMFGATLIGMLVARGVQVTVYAVSSAHSDDLLDAPGASIRLLDMSIAQLDELRQFDMCVFNMGDNAPYHTKILARARQIPGIVVLHDLVIHHMLAEPLFRNDPDGYIRELAYAHGKPGQAFAAAVVAGQIAPWNDPALLEMHGAKAALHGCLGVVVHSRYAQRVVEKIAAAPIRYIPFPTPSIATPPSAPIADLPSHERLGLFTFGMINSNKCVLQVIEAIGRSPYLRGHVRYVVLGRLESGYEYQLSRVIESFHLEKVVTLLGYQPDDVLQDYLRAADVVINLRNPHFGEASWSLLEAAWLGKPTLVWKHGYYDEYPDDAVVKIEKFSQIGPALEMLSTNAAARQQIGERVFAYARATFSTEAYCTQLLEFIEAARASRPAAQLADFVSGVLIEMGADADVPYLMDAIDRELGELMGTSVPERHKIEQDTVDTRILA